jgi:hypothetical protein
MSNYIKTGNTVHVHPGNSIQTGSELFPGIYRIVITMQDMFLEEVSDFELPSKLLGGIDKKADRIIRTFEDRPKNTGVLLSGLKGSGKSLLAKLVSMKLKARNYPTIIVSLEQISPQVCGFLSAIDTDCVVIMDELDKVDEEKQTCLLGLLDGTSTGRKLYMLTGNNKYKVSSWLLNRPGRVFYNFEYTGLDVNVIREYCENELRNKEYIDDIIHVAKGIQDVSFDVLVSLVEECNRYNESPREFIDIMSCEKARDMEYNILLMFGNRRVTGHSNPFKDMNYDLRDEPFTLYFPEDYIIEGWNDEQSCRSYLESTHRDSDEWENLQHRRGRLEFRPDNIVSIRDGVYTYRNEHGWTCVLTPEFRNYYNPYGFFGMYRKPDDFISLTTTSVKPPQAIPCEPDPDDED